MGLLPCPFCGTTSDHKDNCYFVLLALRADTPHLHEAWNRRASPASVPANFKMVPVEPTMEMCEAGWNEYDLQEHFSVRFMYERMIAAAPTPPVSEDRWLPIETAPKDGSKFLAWRRHSTIPLIVFYNAEYDQYECNDGHLVFSITHWMPLPKAPTMQEDKP